MVFNKVQLSVTWPEAMLHDVLRQAHRLDRSLSWCVEQTWLAARDELVRVELGATHLLAEARIVARHLNDGSKAKQTLFFPTEIADEIRLEADRLDQSSSWMLTRAWVLGLHVLHAMPDVAGFDDTFDVEVVTDHHL